jgi:uncharacterized protein
MKALKFILAGVIFGIVLTKSEAISWFRVQEMFRFQAFHMYGIIGTAVVLGAVGVAMIKRFNLKDFFGKPITIAPKEKSITRYLIGGAFYGFGWALTGACPAPMFVNLGYGFSVMGVVIVFATLGTFLYGALKNRLPH